MSEKDLASGNTIKIFYAAIEDGDYYEGWAEQLQQQAKSYGMALEAGYAQNSVETQHSQIKKAVAEEYDVLLCGLVSADTVTEIKAAAGTTPIVFINNAPEDTALQKDHYVYVASDEYMAGQYQAEYILEQFSSKNEISVAILKGPKGASGTIGRTKGLKQTLNASGKQIQYVFEDYADWNTDTAKELTALFLKTGRKVDCVAANNDDMALGAFAAFEQAGVNMDSVLFFGGWMLLQADARQLLMASWILLYTSQCLIKYQQQLKQRKDWRWESRFLISKEHRKMGSIY